MSKLEALAKIYRTMPYGGAILAVCAPYGTRETWVIADGMTVKDEFASGNEAVRALQAAGFYETRPNHWKLRFTLPCGCRIDDQLLCTHGNSQLA